MVGPYSSHSIDRAEHDTANRAKRVNVVTGTVSTNEVLPTSAIGVGQVGMTDSSAPISGDGTARLTGCRCVNIGPSTVYLNVTDAATISKFVLEYGASQLVDIKAQVYGICASGETATISYIDA